MPQESFIISQWAQLDAILPAPLVLSFQLQSLSSARLAVIGVLVVKAQLVIVLKITAPKTTTSSTTPAYSYVLTTTMPTQLPVDV